MFGFKDIEIVREIVRAGGFRAAAQRYGLAQSAISNRIAALEARLGIQLFDRAGRQVRLSALGRRFLEDSERLVRTRDRIVEELTQRRGLQGSVRLGVSETIVHTALTGILKRLRQDHPAMRFELSVDTSEQLSAKLAKDDLDIVILLQEALPTGAVSTPLRPVPLGWYANASLVPADEVMTIDALARHPIVTFPKTTLPYRQIEQLLSKAEGSPPVVHGSASLSTVLHLVGDGFGIGVLPRRMADKALATAPHLMRLSVVDEAEVPDLNFAIAYFPHRNPEAGEVITKIALEADADDLIERSH